MDTTREIIEKEAIKEFMVHGYANTSLRQIVKNVGLTTGAFYKYYPTKEALFAGLVEEHANHIYAIYDTVLGDFQKLSADEQTKNMRDTSQDGIGMMLDYVYEYYDNFKLLLCHADGTPYVNFIHELVLREDMSTRKYIELMRDNGYVSADIDDELIHMIDSGFFTGVFEIVMHDMEKKIAMERVKRLKEFYTGGWEALFGIKL